MRKLLIPIICVVMVLAVSGYFSSALAAGEKVFIQGESFVAEDGGTLEVIEGRIDADGSTFRMWDMADHWVEWKFVVPTDSKYKMTIRYAAGEGAPVRKIDIDGKTIPGLEAYKFQVTGGWCKEENQWVNYTLQSSSKDLLIDLKAGPHTLRMTNVGEDRNGMNIDVMAFLSPEIKADILGSASVVQE